MKVNISLAIWGAWHREVFYRKALPTLLANIPELGVESEVHIYTKDGHQGGFLEAQHAIQKIVPCRLWGEDLRLGYKSAWAHTKEYTEQDDLVMFLQPDIVWSKGSFQHLGELIKAGKKLIFIPHLRGTVSAFDDSLLTGRELLAKVKEDAHPVNVSEEVTSEFGFTKHPEIVLWPFKGGWVCRMFAREPLIAPRWVGYNGHNLPITPMDPGLVHVIESSDLACGVSLCERDREWDHYRNSNVSCSVERVADFASGHAMLQARLVSSKPHLFIYGDADSDEVDSVMEESGSFADRCFNYKEAAEYGAVEIKARRARQQEAIQRMLNPRRKVA